MPILVGLDKDEIAALIHLIHNRNKKEENFAKHHSNLLIDEACSNHAKEKLAKISEEANFLSKNRHLLDVSVINYANKSRMPIDQTKVKDILRNQNQVRAKFRNEIKTYYEY